MTFPWSSELGHPGTAPVQTKFIICSLDIKAEDFLGECLSEPGLDLVKACVRAFGCERIITETWERRRGMWRLYDIISMYIYIPEYLWILFGKSCRKIKATPFWRNDDQQHHHNEAMGRPQPRLDFYLDLQIMPNSKMSQFNEQKVFWFVG